MTRSPRIPRPFRDRLESRGPRDFRVRHVLPTGRAAPLLALAALVTLAVALDPGPALAQADGGGSWLGNSVDNAFDTMRTSLETLAAGMTDRVRELLLLLFTANLVWRAGRWALAGDNIAEVAQGLTYQVVFVALAYMVPLMASDIAHEFGDIAFRLSSPDGKKEDFKAGAMLVQAMTRSLGWFLEVGFNPKTWIYLVAGFIGLIVGAAMAVFVVMAHAELYFVAIGGLVAVAFAGLDATRDIAIGYAKALVGKAAKLLAVIILLKATGDMTELFVKGESGGIEAALGVIMVQLISLMMVITLPGTIESLFTRGGGGAAETAAGKVTSAGTAAGVGMGRDGYKLATGQKKFSDLGAVKMAGGAYRLSRGAASLSRGAMSSLANKLRG